MARISLWSAEDTERHRQVGRRVAVTEGDDLAGRFGNDWLRTGTFEQLTNR
jgi:hypothetical protein